MVVRVRRRACEGRTRESTGESEGAEPRWLPSGWDAAPQLLPQAGLASQIRPPDDTKKAILLQAGVCWKGGARRARREECLFAFLSRALPASGTPGRSSRN